MFDLAAIKHLIKAYPPASPDDIAKAEKRLSLVIPDAYKGFLQAANGAVLNFSALYGTESLVEMNRAYEVQRYAPGYIAIGNDGGGYHILMKAGKPAKEFRMVSDSSGVPSGEDCIDIFEDWLFSETGNPWRNKPEDDEIELAQAELVLIKLPSDGKKGLLRLKSVLRLNMSIGELYRAADNLPFTLCSGITVSNAKAKVNNAGEKDIFEIKLV